MKNDLAPLVLFVYNRLDNTRSTVEYLKKNELAEATDLFIFSDAAKNIGQQDKVKAVREYVRQITGFKSITIFEAGENQGLAKSVITGVTKILKERKKVIVVEDDLITAPKFLEFMNDALNYYKKDINIWSISGYQYPIKMPDRYKKSVYLAYRASSWGWATWLDRWETIDWEIEDYSKYRYNIFQIVKFCEGGTDLDKMLRYQMQGKIDSWAIRWCYNQYRQCKYTIYPVKSLVNNVGMDGDGTHCDETAKRFCTELSYDFEYKFEAIKKPDKEIMKRFRKIVNRSPVRKMKRMLRKLLENGK